MSNSHTSHSSLQDGVPSSSPIQRTDQTQPGSSSEQLYRLQQQHHSIASSERQQPPSPLLRTPSSVSAALDAEQREGLRFIRRFLRATTNYDVLPLSFRLIVFDTSLLVKKSLSILTQNAIVSAPLWDSSTSTFAGMLTTSDYINVIQYYWQNPDALKEIDQFRLSNLRDVEKALGVEALETVSIHPERSLYDACKLMIDSRAHRMPVIDIDDETQRPMIVSVLTQYRLLKFVAMNATETTMLRKPLIDLKIGTYRNIVTARMDTPVIDVIHRLVKHNISSVPILDKDGQLINMIDAVDVVMLIKNGTYDDLDSTVAAALLKRPIDFPGIYTCSPYDRLDTIFDTIRKARVHRFVVVDDNTGQVCGLLTLSDILRHLLTYGAEDNENDEERNEGDECEEKHEQKQPNEVVAADTENGSNEKIETG